MTGRLIDQPRLDRVIYMQTAYMPLVLMEHLTWIGITLLADEVVIERSSSLLLVI